MAEGRGKLPTMALEEDLVLDGRLHGGKGIGGQRPVGFQWDFGSQR